MRKMKKINTRIAYLAFPYGSAPRENTEKASKIATAIMKKDPTIFVIVPHTAIDVTLFGEIPEVVEEHKVEDHLIALKLEYTVLTKVDLLILGCPLDFKVSQGMIWEAAFVEWLNKNGWNIPIVQASFLLGDG